MSINTQSRQALGSLITKLQEIDKRWASEEWQLNSPEDVSQAHRALMHMLEGGIATMFENHPSHPTFRRIVTPTRKFTGDNSDAIYYDAPVSADRSYVVKGKTAGAVYVSVTIEVGTEDGSIGSATAGVINNTEFDVDSAGNFTLYLGGEKQQKNWLPIAKGASRITTRHYYETPTSAAADCAREPNMYIKNLNPEPAPKLDDAEIAAGIKRVINFIETRTLGMPPMSQRKQPDFVGLVPNTFPKPVLPGDMGLAALDAHYSLAPFFLGEDEALVITGKWPECIFANVCLWNRFQQTYDYQNRTVSLNRTQTKVGADGNFKIILAHRDPKQDNWLDTEGNALGLVFWRYFIVKEQPETPVATVVKFADL